MKVYLVFQYKWEVSHEDFVAEFTGLAFATRQTAKNYCNANNRSIDDKVCIYRIEEVEVND